MSVNLSSVLATARTLLNDDAGINWSDTSLIPKAQRAHQELRVKLREAAASVLKNTYTENIAINQLAFNTPPSDIVAPIQLFENSQGGPANGWTLMTESEPLPNLAQAATLIYWTWFEEVVTFLGSTATRQVKMLYWRAIPIPQVGTDLIGFIEGELYMAPRTAALAAGSVGNVEEAKIWADMADDSLGRIILANRGRANQIQSSSITA